MDTVDIFPKNNAQIIRSFIPLQWETVIFIYRYINDNMVLILRIFNSDNDAWNIFNSNNSKSTLMNGSMNIHKYDICTYNRYVNLFDETPMVCDKTPMAHVMIILLWCVIRFQWYVN